MTHTDAVNGSGTRLIRGLRRRLARLRGAGEAIRLQIGHAELRWDDPGFGRYICDKASIAVDGISLTVARCAADGSRFTLAVIPHTWSITTLSHRAVGDRVNLEADQLARYAERLIQSGADHPSEQSSAPVNPPLSADWLSAHGWQ